MKYILAVSGGVDSVVLLDFIASTPIVSTTASQPGFSLGDVPLESGTANSVKTRAADVVETIGASAQTISEDIIIAHFDHGIRKESNRDAEFVRGLAKKYSLPFVLGEAELGKNASEESARKARYEFLRSVAEKHGSAKIVTAHHQDDLIETIVINILRGTGWRGLAPFWSDDILRPLISKTKAEIIQHAIENNLEWVEDETNYSQKYFRNRVRSALCSITKQQRNELIKLYNRQKDLRIKIEEILKTIPNIFGSDPKILKELTGVDDEIGQEILNKMTNSRLTGPQLKRLLKFLRSAKTGDICQPGGKMQIKLERGKISIQDL